MARDAQWTGAEGGEIANYRAISPVNRTTKNHEEFLEFVGSLERACVKVKFDIETKDRQMQEVNVSARHVSREPPTGGCEKVHLRGGRASVCSWQRSPCWRPRGEEKHLPVDAGSREAPTGGRWEKRSAYWWPLGVQKRLLEAFGSREAPDGGHWEQRSAYWWPLGAEKRLMVATGSREVPTGGHWEQRSA
ncbi:hypothetical protein NDU88_011328 [Pleurodeles waltl]|uniref:Uncharacterized protein n=1 Tax=Pleurodeles waltl TaxID=8319 RepID=A0AAV7S390_PLEWA|nr:hypothetical protein NDU88_011328 [Pleurodeles waltl]